MLSIGYGFDFFGSAVTDAHDVARDGLWKAADAVKEIGAATGLRDSEATVNALAGDQVIAVALCRNLLGLDGVAVGSRVYCAVHVGDNLLAEGEYNEVEATGGAVLGAVGRLGPGQVREAKGQLLRVAVWQYGLLGSRLLATLELPVEAHTLSSRP